MSGGILPKLFKPFPLSRISMSLYKDTDYNLSPIKGHYTKDKLNQYKENSQNLNNLRYKPINSASKSKLNKSSSSKNEIEKSPIKERLNSPMVTKNAKISFIKMRKKILPKYPILKRIDFNKCETNNGYSLDNNYVLSNSANIYSNRLKVPKDIRMNTRNIQLTENSKNYSNNLQYLTTDANLNTTNINNTKLNNITNIKTNIKMKFNTNFIDNNLTINNGIKLPRIMNINDNYIKMNNTSSIKDKNRNQVGIRKEEGEEKKGKEENEDDKKDKKDNIFNQINNEYKKTNSPIKEDSSAIFSVTKIPRQKLFNSNSTENNIKSKKNKLFLYNEENGPFSPLTKEEIIQLRNQDLVMIYETQKKLIEKKKIYDYWENGGGNIPNFNFDKGYQNVKKIESIVYKLKNTPTFPVIP